MNYNRIFGVMLVVISLYLLSVVLFPQSSYAKLVGNVIAHNHSSTSAGGSTLAPVTLSSVNAGVCQTGFSRMLINFCKNNTKEVIFTSIATVDVCESVTIPTGAKAILFNVRVTNGSGNVANTLRTTQVDFYSDSACTANNEIGSKSLNTREVNALLGETIGTATSELLVSTTSGQLGVKFTDDAGNSGAAAYFVRGYYD